MPESILASTSPYRRKILEDAGLRVRAVGSGVDETPPDSLSEVAEVVRYLALAKASSVAKRYPGTRVIGADQLGAFPERPGEWFGKPASADAHFDMLARLRGRVHALYTGLAILETDAAGDEVFRHVSHHVTQMHVRADLTDSELRAYVDTAEGRGCAAGYAAEGRGAFLFSAIDGDFFNVLGLPLLAVLRVLRERGWRFEDG